MHRASSSHRMLRNFRWLLTFLRLGLVPQCLPSPRLASDSPTMPLLWGKAAKNGPTPGRAWSPACPLALYQSLLYAATPRDGPRSIIQLGFNHPCLGIHQAERQPDAGLFRLGQVQGCQILLPASVGSAVDMFAHPEPSSLSPMHRASVEGSGLHLSEVWLTTLSTHSSRARLHMVLEGGPHTQPTIGIPWRRGTGSWHDNKAPGNSLVSETVSCTDSRALPIRIMLVAAWARRERRLIGVPVNGNPWLQQWSISKRHRSMSRPKW